MNYLLTHEDLDTNFKVRKGFDFMYNPVPFSQAKRIPIEERDMAVIAVCRLTDQKNVHAIIHAWSAIKDDVHGWTLRIVGDGDQRQELEELARKRNVSDTVEFMGFRKDVQELMSKSRILVMASKYEGLGINIMEAMACGTVPVAYRTHYGPADIITHGEDGFLVDYMYEEKLAATLRGLIVTPDMAERMSRAAAKKAKDFAPERICSLWMEKRGTY